MNQPSSFSLIVLVEQNALVVQLVGRQRYRARRALRGVVIVELGLLEELAVVEHVRELPHGDRGKVLAPRPGVHVAHPHRVPELRVAGRVALQIGEVRHGDGNFLIGQHRRVIAGVHDLPVREASEILLDLQRVAHRLLDSRREDLLDAAADALRGDALREGAGTLRADRPAELREVVLLLHSPPEGVILDPVQLTEAEADRLLLSRDGEHGRGDGDRTCEDRPKGSVPHGALERHELCVPQRQVGGAEDASRGTFARLPARGRPCLLGHRRLDVPHPTRDDKRPEHRQPGSVRCPIAQTSKHETLAEPCFGRRRHRRCSSQNWSPDTKWASPLQPVRKRRADPGAA
jgi:hypothetical protein